MFAQNKLIQKVLVILLISQSVTIINAQDSEKYKQAVLKIVNNVLSQPNFKFIDSQTGLIYNSVSDAPESARLKPASPYNDWRYWNGVLNIALYELSNLLDIEDYKSFMKKSINLAFDNVEYFKSHYNDEGKWNYPFGQFFILEELDDGGAMGASVIELYKNDLQPHYKDYINKVASHIITNQHRLNDGTLARTFPHKFTLWADDLYMALSFLSRLGELTSDNKYFDDAVLQVINLHKYLFNDNKGLMYHNWYSDLERKGVAYWGRANGWAMVAQIDLLERLPEDHPKRDIIIKLLQKHILGIAQYQSGSGLWHQLLDKTDSYLETSCSALFTYTIARAINKGFIEQRYASIAVKGWEGIMMKIREDGQVKGVCTGTVVSDNLVDYYNRPTPLNDIHGIGTVILAGTEILRLTK